MRIRAVILATAFLGATGCATEEQYADALRAWTGRPVSQLVRAWRPPARILAGPGGTRVYQWEWQGVTRHGGAFLQDGLRVQPQTTERYCTTRATVGPDGIIGSWSWDGNGCVARSPGWDFL